MEDGTEAETDDSLLFVPVRRNMAGCVALCTCRLPEGERVGLAFTTLDALVGTLGPDQPWIPLCGRVARGMFAEAGAGHAF